MASRLQSPGITTSTRSYNVAPELQPCPPFMERRLAETRHRLRSSRKTSMTKVHEDSKNSAEDPTAAGDAGRKSCWMTLGDSMMLPWP
eukprot:CAMPEP_0115767888 /NCGR_PEP_ID=MMETSP0272-20121206/103904_1 /TAXON_ID=71861 /ORGANISM="Scrippsiella trochoidea, Strain CCMP3099" /LENGTH=87 /DNA_ID=CAMNT_0003213913 /DNA_START=278 /DNA_END=538 /DNA_ORIENTATION=+